MKRLLPRATTVTPTPSPAVTVVEITDPTAVGEDVQVIEQDAVQLEANPLRARRVVVRLGTSVLLFQSTNLRIRTRTTLHHGMVAYVAFGPRASGTLNGLPVGPDRILASTSGVTVEFVVAAGYESVSFLVPPDDVRTHLRLRQRGDESVIPRGVELLQTSPGAGPRLEAGLSAGSTVNRWRRRGCEPNWRYPHARAAVPFGLIGASQARPLAVKLHVGVGRGRASPGRAGPSVESSFGTPSVARVTARAAIQGARGRSLPCS